MVTQVTVTIDNQSRLDQQINQFEIAVVGLDNGSSTTNEHGDLSGREVYYRSFSRRKLIGAGEADDAYFEVRIPCRFRLVRILVKVLHPTAIREGARRQVYERKLLISLDEACSAATTVPSTARPRLTAGR